MATIKLKEVKYKKIDENTFECEYIMEKELIDLKKIDDEIAQKEQELKNPEPPDKELIAFAKEYHPFYMDKHNLMFEIEVLRNKRDEIKKIIEPEKIVETKK